MAYRSTKSSASARRAVFVAFVTISVAIFALVEALLRLGPHPDIRGLVFGFVYSQHLMVEHYSPVSDLRSLALILFAGYLMTGCLLGAIAGIVSFARTRPWISAIGTWVFLEMILWFLAWHMASVQMINVE